MKTAKLFAVMFLASLFAACVTDDPAVSGMSSVDAGNGADNGMLIKQDTESGAAKPECETKVHCDDGNACTFDLCEKGRCEHAGIPDEALCGDGTPCVPKQFCYGGSCVMSGNTLCDDDQPCTADSCDPKTGCVHVQIPECVTCKFDVDCGVGGGGACDGKTSVGVVNRCINNKCEWLVPYKYECTSACEDGHCMCGNVSDCNDNNPHTKDVCNISGDYPVGYCNIEADTVKYLEVGFGWEILAVTATTTEAGKHFTSFGQGFAWNVGYGSDPMFTIRRKVGGAWKYALSGQCNQALVDQGLLGGNIKGSDGLITPSGIDCETVCLGKNNLFTDENIPVWVCSSKK